MKKIIFLILTLALIACGGKKSAPQVHEIAIPQPPAIGGPDEKAAYMADHFWDNMPFSDTTYINKDVTLQAFSDYAYMLVNIKPELAFSSIEGTMNKAKVEPRMYAYFAKMSEDLFYEPNSPYRNDPIYIKVLENQLAWEGLDDLHKVRPRVQLATARRNMVGAKAENFPIPGGGRNLYDVKSDFVLLYFGNHGCPICATLEADMEKSELIQRLLKSGRLTVVKVFPDDMTAADKELYDTRAMPSMYLLDRNKTVLLKDAMSAAQLEQYFEGA